MRTEEEVKECSTTRFPTTQTRETNTAPTIELPNLENCTEDSDDLTLAKKASDLRVETYNILTSLVYDPNKSSPSEARLSWDFRKHLIVEMIKKSNADIIGLQEVSFKQLVYLKAQLTNFDMIGFAALTGHSLDTIREDENTGEIVPILYNRKTIECLHSQVFWLSPTPEQASIGWDASTFRILTGGVFRIKQTDITIIVSNVHYDHKGHKALINSGRVEIDSVQRLQSRYKASDIFYLGDRNCFNSERSPGNEWYKNFLQESGAKDIRNCENHMGIGTTFLGYPPDKYKARYNNKSEKFDAITIDLIFHKGEKYEIKRSMCSAGEYQITDQGEAKLLPFFSKIQQPETRQFSSDHACLMADFTPKSHF